jgi:hypothetical protein
MPGVKKMRVGFVRSDIQRFYLNDVENTSQRCFSSEPRGQSRYFHMASDTQLLTALNLYAVLSIRGSDGNANVNTAVNNALKIKQPGSAVFTTIVVTTGAVTAKTTIRDDLNRAFIANSLPFVASVVAGDFLQIDTVAPNSGPTAVMQIDSVANGSLLNTAVGFPAGVTTLTGITVAALKAVVLTPPTINVSDAAINALSTFTLLSTAKQTALDDAIANTVAPRLVETGPVLLSFAFGNLSKLRSATFQPGGARIGLPAGVAAYIVEDDGITLFQL